MAGLTLYDLTDSYRNLMELIDNDADDGMIKSAVDTIEDEITVKAVNIANLIKSLEAEAEAIKEEEERLASRRKARENAATNIKQYLQGNLEQLKMDKIRTPTRTVYLQANPPSVEVLDVDKIPQKYLTLVPSHYEVRKKEIATAWKDGEKNIEGVKITQGRSLRIR